MERPWVPINFEILMPRGVVRWDRVTQEL